MNLSQSNLSKNILLLILTMATPFTLIACGGGSDSDKIKKEYDRIEDQVSNLGDDIKDDYRKFEDKLSDEEKSMARVLESVFLPEKTEENFKQFLDKITPEGGKGGLYIGHFVENNDGDNTDIDVGAIYFDISNDFGGSVDGRVSYQQKACQLNRTLSTKTAVKVDGAIAGKLSGSLDSLELLNIKYIRDLNVETPNILTTFSGKFEKSHAGAPWAGNFEYQDGLGGTKLSSGEDGCDVNYTLGRQSNFKTYPLDYELGKLNVNMKGTGSVKTLSWTTPSNAAIILVSQVNVNKTSTGANGFERNQIFTNGKNQYSPVVTDKSTNYAFVVQAFDKENKLIAYDALVADLPDAK